MRRTTCGAEDSLITPIRILLPAVQLVVHSEGHALLEAAVGVRRPPDVVALKVSVSDVERERDGTRKQGRDETEQDGREGETRNGAEWETRRDSERRQNRGHKTEHNTERNGRQERQGRRASVKWGTRTKGRHETEHNVGHRRHINVSGGRHRRTTGGGEPSSPKVPPPIPTPLITLPLLHTQTPPALATLLSPFASSADWGSGMGGNVERRQNGWGGHGRNEVGDGEG